MSRVSPMREGAGEREKRNIIRERREKKGESKREKVRDESWVSRDTALRYCNLSLQDTTMTIRTHHVITAVWRWLSSRAGRERGRRER